MICWRQLQVSALKSLNESSRREITEHQIDALTVVTVFLCDDFSTLFAWVFHPVLQSQLQTLRLGEDDRCTSHQSHSFVLAWCMRFLVILGDAKTALRGYQTQFLMTETSAYYWSVRGGKEMDRRVNSYFSLYGIIVSLLSSVTIDCCRRCSRRYCLLQLG